MRLDINLASHPYEDARRFVIRWGSIVVAIALLTAGLALVVANTLLRSRDITRQIAEVRHEIEKLDREKSSGLAVLNQPQNRELRERSRFLNELIVRKAFSWTKVFSDLERIIPPRLHVMSMRPVLTEDNQLEIRLIVAGDSRDKAVDLVRRMEQSQRFRQAEVRSESAVQQTQNSTDTVQFEISAVYVPEVAGGAP
jgi:type IV pilus assembly protein PilN